MLQRNLVYTGVTRGKRLVVLVGNGGRSLLPSRERKQGDVVEAAGVADGLWPPSEAVPMQRVLSWFSHVCSLSAVFLS